MSSSLLHPSVPLPILSYDMSGGSIEAKAHRRHSTSGKSVEFIEERNLYAMADHNPSLSRRKTFIRKIRTSLFGKSKKDAKEISRRISMPPTTGTGAADESIASAPVTPAHQPRKMIPRPASLPHLVTKEPHISNDERPIETVTRRGFEAPRPNMNDGGMHSAWAPSDKLEAGRTSSDDSMESFGAQWSSAPVTPLRPKTHFEAFPFPSGSPHSRDASDTPIKPHRHVNHIRPSPSMRSTSLISRHSFESTSSAGGSVLESVEDNIPFLPFCLPEDEGAKVKMTTSEEVQTDEISPVPVSEETQRDAKPPIPISEEVKTEESSCIIIPSFEISPPSPIETEGKSIETIFVDLESSKQAAEEKDSDSHSITSSSAEEAFFQAAATSVDVNINLTIPTPAPAPEPSLASLSDSRSSTPKPHPQRESNPQPSSGSDWDPSYSLISNIRHRLVSFTSEAYQASPSPIMLYQPTVIAVASIGVFAMVSRILRS